VNGFDLYIFSYFYFWAGEMGVEMNDCALREVVIVGGGG